MANEAKKPNLIQHFEKSPDYRSIIATGIYGGGTINGLLSLNIITDVFPTPISTESEQRGNELHQLKVDMGGKVAVREVQCNIMMDISTAKLYMKWLENNIKILENALSQSKSI